MPDLSKSELLSSGKFDPNEAIQSQLQKGKIVNLNELVFATVSKPGFLDLFVPTLCDSVTTAILPSINDAIRNSVSECMKPFVEQINSQRTEIDQLQSENIILKEENKCLHDKIDDLSNVVEQLEQHGRRNTLRFHNIPLTQNQIKSTDEVLIKFLHEKLDITITDADIDRSHILGKINRFNKAQIICRFRSWNIKNKIFKSKSKLAKNPDKIFISEDLTQPRRELVVRLNHLRKSQIIQSSWTHDGSIFAKVSESSRTMKILCHSDIDNLDPSATGSSSGDNLDPSTIGSSS